MMNLQLLDKYTTTDILFINSSPILAYIDEVSFKNKEKLVKTLIDYELVDNFYNIVYQGDNYNIKEFTNYRDMRNEYNHTDLILYKNDEVITTKPSNLIIYKDTLNIENCKIAKDEDVLIILDEYNIVSIGGNEIIGDNTILNSPITHKIAIKHLYNLTSANSIQIGKDYFKIVNIENLDNIGKFLILDCEKYNDNERII